MSKSKEKSGKGERKSPLFAVVFVILIFVFGGVAGAYWKASKNAGPDANQVREFLTNYFKTWSSKDMDGYGACFDPSAMIYFIKDGTVVLRQDKPDFIAGQTEALKMPSRSVEEHAESMEIMAEGDVVYARVFWKLTRDEVSRYGYDHFTLLHTPAGWRIIALAFYELPEKH